VLLHCITPDGRALVRTTWSDYMSWVTHRVLDGLWREPLRGVTLATHPATSPDRRDRCVRATHEPWPRIGHPWDDADTREAVRDLAALATRIDEVGYTHATTTVPVPALRMAGFLPTVPLLTHAALAVTT